MWVSPYSQLFYFIERFEICDLFKWKIISFIFTATFAHIY